MINSKVVRPVPETLKKRRAFSGKAWLKKAGSLRKKRPAFSVRPGFLIYLILLVSSLIFTQALYSPLSSMLFVFMLFLPPISLLYTLCAHIAIKANVVIKAPTVEKLSPAEYEILLVNESILPFPYVEVFCTVPSEDTVRCAEQRLITVMNPFGRYSIKNTVRFKYRGNYNIGVTDILVCDFFKLFRIKIKADKSSSFCILPRKLDIDGISSFIPSEESGDPREPAFGLEKAEMRDIRSYKTGDSPKSIHWKLSFKTEELQVRDYIPNPSRKTLILCDLSENSGLFSDSPLYELEKPEYYDDMNEFCADAITELAVSAVLRELKSGSECRLAWFDKRSSVGYYDFNLESTGSFEAIFANFASSPLCPAENSVVRLLSALQDTQAASVIIVTSDSSPATAGELSVFASSGVMSSTHTEVVLFNPHARYKNKEIRQNHTEAYKKQLADHGISLTEWQGEI